MSRRTDVRSARFRGGVPAGYVALRVGLGVTRGVVAVPEDRRIAGCVQTGNAIFLSVENLAFGVGQARRGWLTREDVVNSREAEALLGVLRRPA